MPHEPLDDAAMRRLRMASLLLDEPGTGRHGVAEVVAWFGAMQAQDPAGVAWSLGLRTGSSRSEVADALATGEVVRTWPMRGTLHVVPARDARWMLEHLGRRALATATARRAALGLDPATADRAAEVLGAALAGGRVLTRAECVAELASAGIATPGQRAYHLLWYASALGITCVGPPRGREQTFARLDALAPVQNALDRPAALATIAERFVRSHGPVTVHDLARWADLTVADARAGIAAAPGLVHRTDGRGRAVVVAEEVLDSAPAGKSAGPAPALALPGFDELVLGYRDRTAQLDADHEALVVPGGNGMFAATLVRSGRVVGTWRRRELARRVAITATPFARLPAPDRTALTRALEGYAGYLGLEPDITWAA
jgi:hypothetical protein